MVHRAINNYLLVVLSPRVKCRILSREVSFSPLIIAPELGTSLSEAWTFSNLQRDGVPRRLSGHNSTQKLGAPHVRRTELGHYKIPHVHFPLPTLQLTVTNVTYRHTAGFRVGRALPYHLF